MNTDKTVPRHLGERRPVANSNTYTVQQARLDSYSQHQQQFFSALPFPGRPHLSAGVLPTRFTPDILLVSRFISSTSHVVFMSCWSHTDEDVFIHLCGWSPNYRAYFLYVFTSCWYPGVLSLQLTFLSHAGLLA